MRPAEIAGATILETVAALSMAGILASIAMPHLQDHSRRARRADGWSALALLQMAQERHHLATGSYADRLEALGLSAISPAGHYVVRIETITVSGYTLAAQAQAGSSQAADWACRVLALRREGPRVDPMAAGEDGTLVPDAEGRCGVR